MRKLFFIGLFCCLLSIKCFAQQKSKSPNIIVILVDDAGYNDFNFMGSSNLETPIINNMANQGIIFKDAHVTSTVCAPSRAGLLTGSYQQKSGFECNQPPKGYGLKSTLPTIGSIAQKKGYKTVAIGKWHLGEIEESHPNNMGFDEFYGFLEGGHHYFKKALLHNKSVVNFNGYLTDVFGDRAVDYIEKYKSQPFLMYFSPNAVHTPMHAKAIHLDKYKNHPRKELAAMAWSLDENVYKIYKKLEIEGLLENTLIIFLSDNGGAIGNQSSNSPYTALESSVLKGWKGNEFEGGHRVPFFIHWKNKIEGGHTFNGLTSSLDVFATIDAVTNSNETNSLLTKTDGVNLMPYLLNKKKGNPHTKLFWRYDATVAMRSRNYKFIEVNNMDFALYDLNTDLKERNDISKENPKLIKKIKRDINKWEGNLKSPLWRDDEGWREVTKQINTSLLKNKKPKNNYPKEMENHKIIKKTAEMLFKTEADLGEGPVWIPETQELLWVDINKGLVHATNIAEMEDKIIYVGEKPSCIIPVSDNKYLIADLNKIIELDINTNDIIEKTTINFNIPNVRFNDGKSDSNGNMWVGTMEMSVAPNKGKLYLIKGDEVLEKLDSVTISNGLTWSLDKKTMYYIDTVEHGVYAFDFNSKSEISNQRVAFNIPKELGSPDGMTIDANGNLWIAMWGGHAVICWNPKSGQILEKIEVAAPNVTSCVFGGKNMNTLFITTAREGLSISDLEKYPNSGSVFSVELEITGFESFSFSKK